MTAHIAHPLAVDQTVSPALRSAASPIRPAASIGAQAKQDHACPTGGAGAPNLSTYCPDCGASFSYRIVDEDTGCRYPVDDGEHYCEPCDALFTDEYLSGLGLTEIEHLGPGRIAA